MKNNSRNKILQIRGNLTRVVSTAEGNPEPKSKRNRLCVETRRRACIRCNNEISPKKYSSAKYCSEICRDRDGSYRYRVKHGLIKNPGVGSGNNQPIGPTHPTYKNGIGSFAKRAFERYEHKCAWCKSKRHLLVHHKNHDRTNNRLSNLIIVCKSCHQKHHTKRDPKTGQYMKG